MNARADDGTPYSEFPEREEDTHSGLPLSSMPPLPEDRDEALGVLYASVARQGRHLEGIKRQLGTVTTETTGLRKDFAEFRSELKVDRSRLVNAASTKAARHSSNRAAGIMGGLFMLYELVSPYVHELWKLVHHG